MSETAVYRIELEIFSGPLDLLLYLVRKNEVDVTQLSIARITEQFCEMLEVIELIDLDLAGDFVLMASTLLEIKSRLVLPRPEEEAPIAEEGPLTDDNPRSELIQRLLEYRRFKEAALALEDRAAEWGERYPRLSNDWPAAVKDPAADRIKQVELWDLVSALGRVLRHQQIDEETSVKYDETPIAVYVERVGEQVRREGEVRFTSLFEGETTRSRIVGLFLAVLELLRHHQFRAEQLEDYGEIVIRPPLEEVETPRGLPEASSVRTPESAGNERAEPRD